MPGDFKPNSDIATKEKAEEQIMTAQELIEQIEIYCLGRINE